MNDFAPKFPRSVSGRNFRLPFDHPDVEAVGALADRLYRQLPLSEIERGRLITLYANLAKADFRLWSAIGEQRISDDGSRPASLELSAREAWMSGATATLGYKIDRCTGYVFRCRDYLQKLADKYSGAEHGTLGIIENQDAPRPAEPIYGPPVLANGGGDPGEPEYDPETGEIIADSDDPDRQLTDEI